MSITYKIEFDFAGRGIWTDVTADVHQAQWRFGQLQPNQVGTVMRPADGSISLHNQDGKYTAYNPARGIDPTPGVPVRISVGGHILFQGWSEGFHTLTPLTENYMTEVPIVGPLYRYNTYNQGIFRRVNGSPTTGELLRLALGEVGFNLGNAVITADRTRIYDYRANSSALLGDNRRPTSLLDVCKTLAQAELGRIYDDRRGYIVFEGRQVRAQRPPTGPVNPDSGINLFVFENNDDVAIVDMKMTRIADAIINSAKSQVDNYESQGKQDVALEGIPSSSFTVSANFVTNTTYTFKTTANIAFVQSWEPLVQNTHYEYKEADGSDVDGADLQVFLLSRGDGVTISFVNATDTDRTAKVLKLEGDVWQQTSTQELNTRSEQSITKYGLKEVVIPLNLVVNEDREEIKDHLEWVINTHNGFQGNTATVNPMRQINLTYKINDDEDVYFHIDISDIVQITSPRMGLGATRFWVDAVDYKIDNQGSLVVKLGLTDARYTAAWGVNEMTFSESTRPMF